MDARTGSGFRRVLGFAVAGAFAAVVGGGLLRTGTRPEAPAVAEPDRSVPAPRTHPSAEAVAGSPEKPPGPGAAGPVAGPTPSAPDPGEPDTIPPPSHRDLLQRIRGCDSALAVFHYLRGGWNGGREGLERAARGLEEWEALLGERRPEWRGPILLARANAKHALGGNDREVMDLLVRALLAMDREGPDPPWGVPRLYVFATGRNLAPHSAEDPVSMDGGPFRSDTRSGGRVFLAGTPLLPYGTEGRRFEEWLAGVARDGEHPEEALAASIWLHAVSVRPRHVRGFDAPPAAVDLLEAWRPGGNLSEAGSTVWWQGVAMALQDALSREDPAALDLEAERARRAAWERRSGTMHRGVVHGSEWVWSLRREVLDRFASLDGDRGRALRALAVRLVAWD